MPSNPLIKRYSYSSFRKRQLWIYATIYFTLLIVLFFINYSIHLNRRAFGDPGNIYNALYFQFIIFQGFLMCIWSAKNSGTAIRDEILQKSYDFFRMLPIPAIQKAVGILIGKNLVVLLVACFNFVFILLFGLFSDIYLTLQMQLLLCLISVAFFTNSIALLTSVCTKPNPKNQGGIAAIIMAFIIIPNIIAAILNLSDAHDIQSLPVKFYGFDIPLLLMISAVALYLACWSLKGIVRKFNFENQPLFTKKGAWLFTLGYELIIAGFFVPYFFEGSQVIYAFWAATLAPLFLVVPASLKGLENYIEHSRLIQDKISSDRSMIGPVLAYSNMATWLGLFVIWSVFAVWTVFAAKLSLAENLISILVIFSSYLFVILLAEIYSIYKFSNPRIGMLVAFIMIMFFVLPLIFGGIFESESILLFSPFGYFANLFEDFSENQVQDFVIGILNSLLCIVPAVIVIKQYGLIVEVREILSASGERK